MGELTENLRKTPKDGRPIFAMTRPLELHIGNIATATVPAGESYPGFYGPYAARVKRIDACFGEFLGALKELHLYDNSIIVLTADHGDSLGEGQRWGHGFTVFPEVMRIPLVIHVPPALRSRVTADLARVSFSIDITPTLYALAGEMPAAPREREELLGEPLLVPPSVDLSRRRRGAVPCGVQLRGGLRPAGPQWPPLVHRRRNRGTRVCLRSEPRRRRPADRHDRCRARRGSAGNPPPDWRTGGLVPLHAGSVT